MEAAGLIPQAADYYFTAAIKNPNNPEALVALQRTGQWVLNSRITEFEQAQLRGNRSEALEAYDSALEYIKRVQQAGIELLILESSKEAFERVKSDHLDDLYERGMQALENENFEESQDIFDELIRLDSNFKDAVKWSNVSFCEPRYRLANDHLEQKQWRSAYELYAAILSRDKDYKKAQQMLESALSKGQFTIALLPFENGTNRSGLDTKFQSYVEEALMQSEDPFLEIVDREHQALILQEQKLALSGVLNANSAVEVGQLLGAKTLMKGSVVDCEIVTSGMQSQSKKGFESYQVLRITEEGKKVYDKKYREVSYREFYATRKAKITFRIALLSMETGQNLMSEMLSLETSDAIRFADYPGNKDNVFPCNASGNLNRLGKRNLRALFTARRVLSEESVLINTTVQSLAQKIRGQVENEMLQLVP